MHDEWPLLLATLACPPVASASAGDDLAAWWRGHRARVAPWSWPPAHALLGGFYADRLGYAFVAGYRAALDRLLGDAAGDAMASLCITESGGGHPRAIQTTLRRDGDGWRLDGSKQWSTGATAADVLWVAARVGSKPDGRPDLRLARVPVTAAGVTVTAMPPPPFAPEVPHAAVTFADVRLHDNAVLAGDAYAQAIKPFRTHEDVYVSAAACGYVLGVAWRHEWPAATVESLLAQAATWVALAALDAAAASTHRALAGAQAAQAELWMALAPHWAMVAADEAARFERDAALFTVAAKARATRLVKARASG